MLAIVDADEYIIMPSRALDDNVGLMHKRTNGELTPTEKAGFSRTKTECRAIGYRDNPAKAGWSVGMHRDFLEGILRLINSYVHIDSG